MMPKKGHLELEERVERGGVERSGVAKLEDLGEIRLVKVSGHEDSRYGIWKGMLEEHHYLHRAKLYGQQIKYLVEEEKPAGRVKVSVKGKDKKTREAMLIIAILFNEGSGVYHFDSG